MKTQQQNIDTIKKYTVNGYKAFAVEVITVTTLKMLGVSFLALEPKAVHIYVESSIATRAIRYYYDGTTPAAGDGIGRFDNDEFLLEEFSNLQNFKVIQEAAGTHKLFVTYLK